MGLFSPTSPRRKSSFLRIPTSPLGEDEPFIESSQALDVHRFEHKLNILTFTTGLLSIAVVALLVVTVLRDFGGLQQLHSATTATVSHGTVPLSSPFVLARGMSGGGGEM